MSAPPWTNNNTYTPYDEVSYIGDTFYCIVQNIGIPPTNALYWTAVGGGGGGGGFTNINGLGPPTLTIKSANNATLTVATDLPTSSISLTSIPAQTGVQTILAGIGTTVNSGQPQQPSIDLNLTQGTGITLTNPIGTSGPVTIANSGVLSVAETTATGSGISITGTSANPRIATNLVAGDGIILTPSTTTDAITIASPPPAGSSGQLIYNNAGTYAGTAGVTYSGGILKLDSFLNYANGQVKVGTNAGLTSQSQYAVGIGINAGQTSQGESAIGIGYSAGQTTQGSNAIGIGANAGLTGQGVEAVAIGLNAGSTSQAQDSVAVGAYAGQTSQAIYSVAVGSSAANAGQQTRAVAVGHSAGQTSQGQYSIAVGDSAGLTNQGAEAVAIGASAGSTAQGDYCIAIGTNAGATNQTTDAICIGGNSATTGQGQAAIAIGKNAGNANQGQYSIAIGKNAGLGASSAQFQNTIILNATGGEVNGVAGQANSLYIAPIRNDTTTSGLQILHYNPSTKEVIYRISSGDLAPVLLEAGNAINTVTAVLTGNSLPQQIFQTSTYTIPFAGRVVMTVTGIYANVSGSGSGGSLQLQINDQNNSINAITQNTPLAILITSFYSPSVMGGRVYSAGTAVQFTFKGTNSNAGGSNLGISCSSIGYTMILYPTYP